MHMSLSKSLRKYLNILSSGTHLIQVLTTFQVWINPLTQYGVKLEMTQYFDSLFESLHETTDYTTDENVSNMSVMESDTDNSALFDMLLH